MLVPLVLAGCWPDARPRPMTTDETAPAEILVFSDGFHSGLIVPEAICPVRFADDPVPDRQADWVEIGFSDYDWATWHTRSNTHILRLLVVPARGSIVVHYTGGPHRAPGVLAPRRIVRLPLTPVGVTVLRDYLAETMDVAGGVLKSSEFPNYWLVPSVCDYQLTWNCHDYTARALRRVGCPMRHDLFRTATSLEGELATLAERLQEADHPVGPDRPLSLVCSTAH